MSPMSPASSTIETPAETFRDKILRKCGESVEMKQKFFEKYSEQIEAMSRDMAARFQSGKKLLVMGNGGSLCDALHFCLEFTHPITLVHVAWDLIHIAMGEDDVI